MPRLKVPDYIVPPSYIKEKNPVFGIYEGEPEIPSIEKRLKLKNAG